MTLLIGPWSTKSTFLNFLLPVIFCFHYVRENANVIYRNLFSLKNLKFHGKNFVIFDSFAQNIDCGYRLDPPRQRGSDEYPQSMFLSKNKKNSYTLVSPRFTIYKWD